MKIFLSFIVSVFLLTCSFLVSAYPVTDVVVFNKTLGVGDFVSWEHDMTQYGYDPADGYSDFTLTLEVRDAEDAPWKLDEDRPFYMLSQGHGRSFGRVLMEDLVFSEGETAIYLEADGVARPRFAVLEGNIWIGSAILTIDLPQTSIPEPGIAVLLGLGLLGLGLTRQYR